MTTLIGHSSHVWCASFMSNGSAVATCSSDETVRVWTLQPVVKQSVSLRHHVGVVRSCRFSPNSALLASCSWDKHILVYESSDFTAAALKLVGHNYGVSSVQFSPNGTLLASCSWDDTVGLWDVEVGKMVHQLRGHQSPVAACAFTVDGTSIVSCSWDGTVKIWDLSLSQAVCTLEGHPDAVYDISCSPADPRLIATCGRKGALILWDIAAKAPWQILQKGWKEINCVCFSPCGNQFATGNDLCEVHLWDMSAIKTSSIDPLVLSGHAGSVAGVSYSPDNRLLASCSSDFTCRIWDLSQTKETLVSSLAESLSTGLSLNNDQYT